MRTVHVDVTVHMVLKLDENVDVSNFINDSEYSFLAPNDQNGEIEDTEIRDIKVTDMRR